MKKLSIPCIYCGKPSTLTVMQGRIDIVYTVGKTVKPDSFSSIGVCGDAVTFHGLYFGNLLKPIEITRDQAKQIAAFFKVRVSHLSQAYYLNKSVTDFKVASCGEDIYTKVLENRAAMARKWLKRKYAA